MDAQHFLEELPRLFEDYPRSEHPLDRRFQPVVETVTNLATENTLALLNLAASLLHPGEAYAEVGVYHGASLIASMMGNEDKRFIGIDTFDFREGSVESVEANLERFGVPRPEILVGDAFELVPGGAIEERSVGVWYYDAAHDYDSQVRGLAIAEPLLVDGALVIVDDTDWSRVAQAMDDYLAAQPRARRVLEVVGKERGFPHWWEGMQVLEWNGRA
jgi:predicted O-methyltransferase YrrM